MSILDEIARRRRASALRRLGPPPGALPARFPGAAQRSAAQRGAAQRQPLAPRALLPPAAPSQPGAPTVNASVAAPPVGVTPPVVAAPPPVVAAPEPVAPVPAPVVAAPEPTAVPEPRVVAQPRIAAEALSKIDAIAAEIAVAPAPEIAPEPEVEPEPVFVVVPETEPEPIIPPTPAPIFASISSLAPAAAEAPAAEVETPAAEAETPAAEVDAPAAEAETPAAEVDAPEAKVKAPEPEAEVETPEPEAETPEPQAEMPAREVEAPAPEPRDFEPRFAPEAATADFPAIRDPPAARLADRPIETPRYESWLPTPDLFRLTTEPVTSTELVPVGPAETGISVGGGLRHVLKLPGFVTRTQMRRRIRYLRHLREVQLRDLGGFTLELHRFGREKPEIVQAKLESAAQTDRELRELQMLLSGKVELREVREPGIGGACEHCGAVYGSEDRFCSNCGEPLPGTSVLETDMRRR